MARDRLNDGAAASTAVRPLATEDDQRRWCSEQNAWARRVGVLRWYWVRRIQQDGQEERRRIEVAEGGDAEELQKFRAHKLDPYLNWPEDRLDKLRRRLRWQLRQGMTDDEFAAWSQRSLEINPGTSPDPVEPELI